jgi:3-phenylpropionate/trans-cinnamate dioxygenase ferredoxin component
MNYTTLSPDKLEYLEIAPAGECPSGERLFVTIENTPIVIFNIAGKFFAIEDTCSHDGNPLDDAPIEGDDIVCLRHGAHFDLRSGKALTMPAVEDIAAYPVRVTDGQIELGWPKS